VFREKHFGRYFPLLSYEFSKTAFRTCAAAPKFSEIGKLGRDLLEEDHKYDSKVQVKTKLDTGTVNKQNILDLVAFVCVQFRVQSAHLSLR
jgi:hypothetical protein